MRLDTQAPGLHTQRVARATPKPGKEQEYDEYDACLIQQIIICLYRLTAAQCDKRKCDEEEQRQHEQRIVDDRAKSS